MTIGRVSRLRNYGHFRFGVESGRTNGRYLAPASRQLQQRRLRSAFVERSQQAAAQNVLQQQAKFDDVIAYNQERPHQALDMKYPAKLYRPSLRPYRGLGELDYPFHDRTITVTHGGRICLGKRKINLSQAFAGQNVGIKEVSDRIWVVTSCTKTWDSSTTRHVGSNRSPTPSSRTCYPCLRYKPLPM